MVSKVKDILDIIAWLNIDGYDENGIQIISNAHLLVSKILTAYTDIPLKTLMPFQSPRRSGTQQHHLRGRDYRASIVTNTLPNYTTRVKGESNTHIVFRTSVDHLAVNFLHIYAHITWLSMGELEVGRYLTSPSMIWGVTTECKYCTRAIPDVPMVFKEELIKRCEPVRLNITNIGEIAEEIVCKSLDNYISKNLITRMGLQASDEEKIRISSIGVMQEALDSTYSRKVQVQDRFGSHAAGTEEYHILSTLTDSGTKKSVGLTEMKCLQTDLLAEFLISVATSTLEAHVREFTKHNVIEWLLITPVTQIPWYGLCQWLYESNRLGDIISFLHKQVKIPPGMSYNDVPSATRYIVEI